MENCIDGLRTFKAELKLLYPRSIKFMHARFRSISLSFSPNLVGLLNSIRLFLRQNNTNSKKSINLSSAAGQPTRSTQPFILSGSINELQSDVRSGVAVWWMLTWWRPGVVDWSGGVFAGCLARVQLFVSMCNGRPHLALQHHWLLPLNCHFDDKARLVRFPCKTRYIRIPGFSFNNLFIT